MDDEEGVPTVVAEPDSTTVLMPFGTAEDALLQAAGTRQLRDAADRGRVTSPGAVFGVLALVTVSFTFQQTMILPALPSLQASLGVSTAWIAWTVTAFTATSIVAAAVFGRLADLYGRERLLAVSVAVFFMGSLASIFAVNAWMLIALRAIQGLGGGAIPIMYAIVRDRFLPTEMPHKLGVLASLSVGASGLGFVVSGVLVDFLSWRLMFAVGAVPVGIALVLVMAIRPQHRPVGGRVDILGAVILTSALGTLLVGLTEGPSWHWASQRTAGTLLAALTLLIVWGAVELQRAEPLIDVRMLGRRSVLIANVATFFGGMAFLAPFILLPKFMQAPAGTGVHNGHGGYGFGLSNLQSGLCILPHTVAGLVFGQAAGRVIRRLGARATMVLGMEVAAAGFVCMSLWHAHVWQLLIGLVFVGAGWPLSAASTTSIVVSAVPATDAGVAAGVNAVVRSTGSVLGAQAAAAILTTWTVAHSATPTLRAYSLAFGAAALAAAISGVVALWVASHAALNRPAADGGFGSLGDVV